MYNKNNNKLWWNKRKFKNYKYNVSKISMMHCQF